MKEYQGIQITKLIGKSVTSDLREHHVNLSVQILKDMVSSNLIKKEEINVIIYITQTPMFMTPSSTFYIHKHLGLHQDCFQYDVNQGGTGFVTGIQLASSLLLGFSNAKKAVVIFGDNNLRNSDGIENNIAVVSILEQNEESNIHIDNCSIGNQYEVFYKDNKGNIYLDEKKCMELIKVKKDELAWTDSDVFFDDSSVRAPVRLIESKQIGDTTICVAGAGLAIAQMNCYLNSSVY